MTQDQSDSQARDRSLRPRIVNLSRAQRATLARRLIRTRDLPIPRLPPGPGDTGGTIVRPASFSQRRMWFLHHYSPATPLYNSPRAFRMQGPLDTDVLGTAIAQLARRHDSLRATLEMREGEIAQRIHPGTWPVLEVQDLGHLPEARREREADLAIRAMAAKPFDLNRGPLFRALLVRLRPDDHALLTVFHHAITDGWSMAVFWKELGALYRHLAAHDPPPVAPSIQYSDFSEWQRQWLSGEPLEQEIRHWREQLLGAPTHLDLPADRPRPRQESFRGETPDTSLAAFIVPDNAGPPSQDHLRDQARQHLPDHMVPATFEIIEELPLSPNGKDFISPYTLFHAPAVAALASTLGDKNWAPPWSSLVPMQTSGINPPFFFVHGMGGETFAFLDLARMLAPHQPSYGVQAVDLAGRARRHDSIEAMAAHHAAEICSFQPTGPCYLGGYSLGGVIAYEVARHIRTMGRQIGMLALIDSHATCSVPWGIYARLMIPFFTSRSRYHASRLFSLPRHQRLDYMRGRLIALRNIIARNIRRPAAAGHPEPFARAKSADNPAIDHYRAMASAYRPGPFDGVVDLFLGESARLHSVSLWKHLAAEVRLHAVAGRHSEILSKDHILQFTKTFAAALARAQSEQA